MLVFPYCVVVAILAPVLATGSIGKLWQFIDHGCTFV